MVINNTQSPLVTKANTAYAKAPGATQRNDQANAALEAAKTPKDEYIPSDPNVRKAGYDNPMKKADAATIARLKQESERVYSSMRETVKQMLKEQGLAFIGAAGETDAEDKTETGQVEGLPEDAETKRTPQEEAAALVGEGGALSPEKLSDTLIEFAKSLSGGDQSKAGLLRDAIKEGFKQAEEAWGGKLPEISSKTYDLVMEKLDRWEKGTEATTQSGTGAVGLA